MTMLIFAIAFAIACYSLATLKRQLTQLQHRLSQIEQENRATYAELGQAIAALNIQLQAAHKLWQINPIEAQRSLYQAYLLSTSLMQDIRQTIKTNPSRFQNYDLLYPQNSVASRR